MSSVNRAPEAGPAYPSTPLDAIDVQLAGRLLAAALSTGGDHADLYFAYQSAADFAFE